MVLYGGPVDRGGEGQGRWQGETREGIGRRGLGVQPNRGPRELRPLNLETRP